jgi:hypothetical protein
MRKDITAERQTTRDAPETTEETRSLAFAHRVLIATCIVAGMALVLVFVWYAADLLLLVFAGILVSILLRGFSRFVTQKNGPGAWAVAGPHLARPARPHRRQRVVDWGQCRRADKRTPTATTASR